MNEKHINIKEMMELSNSLYERHKDEWVAQTPESGIYWISWLVAEIGEVIDIIKKKGTEKIMSDETTRAEMLREIVDCYMYLADILIRFGYSSEDFSSAYREKMTFNLSRRYIRPKAK